MKTTKGLIPGLLATAMSLSCAADVTWIGGTYGNWEDGANWDGNEGKIPGKSMVAVFTNEATVAMTAATPVGSITFPESGEPLTVTSVNDGSLKVSTAGFLASGKTLKVDGGTVSGPVNPNTRQNLFAPDAAGALLELTNGGKYLGDVRYSTTQAVAAPCRVYSHDGDNQIGYVVPDSRNAEFVLTVADGSLTAEAVVTEGGDNNPVRLAVAITNAELVVTGELKNNSGKSARNARMDFDLQLADGDTDAARIQVGGAATIWAKYATGYCFAIDATQLTKGGTFPIITASTLTLKSDDALATNGAKLYGNSDYWQVNAATGVEWYLEREGGTVSLVLSAPGLQENAWTVPPSISTNTWKKGEAAGILSVGEALSGDTPTSNYTQDEINAFDYGTHVIKVSVPEGETYKALSTNIEVVVTGMDTEPATYTWNSAVGSGTWATTANWIKGEGASQDFPSNSLSTVVFGAGTYSVDGEGATYPIAGMSTPDANQLLNLTFRNVTLHCNGGDMPTKAEAGKLATGSRLVFENANVTFNNRCPSLYAVPGLLKFSGNCNIAADIGLYSAADPEIRFENGTINVSRALEFTGSTIATSKYLTVVSNACVTVNGSKGFVLGNAAGIQPTLVLDNGRVDITGPFSMTTPITNELVLAAGDMAVPRIQASKNVSLSNIVFKVTADTPGRYPLFKAGAKSDYSLSLPNGSLDGLTVLRKKGDLYMELEYAEDEKTLYLNVLRRGAMFFIK